MRLGNYFFIIALPFLFLIVGFNTGNFNQSFPGPDLFYPVTDNIDLKGSGYLEFKWRRTDSAYTRHYDFRLYKGYQATATNLILKKNIAIEEYPYRIPSGDFKDGQIYTWVLIQILNNGIKSDKSFGVFKIIKK